MQTMAQRALNATPAGDTFVIDPRNIECVVCTGYSVHINLKDSSYIRVDSKTVREELRQLNVIAGVNADYASGN